MSFWLYTKKELSYTKAESVKLGGASGVLAQFLQEHRDENTPFAWKLTASEIINRINQKNSSENMALLCDMSSLADAMICFYQVDSVQGNSEYDETDLVLNMYPLYEERSSDQSKLNHFELVKPSGSNRLIEPIHLTGGTREGSYCWSKPKMDIGAAIYSKQF